MNNDNFATILAAPEVEITGEFDRMTGAEWSVAEETALFERTARATAESYAAVRAQRTYRATRAHVLRSIADAWLAPEEDDSGA
jgi:hypothetical protein